MTDKQYYHCVAEATAYADREAYVSDLALSTIWMDGAEAPIPEERLGGIWDAAHRSVKEIAAAAGMSCRKLAERCCIPYRTVEDWSTGKRNPPPYVPLMMQECLGLVKR